MTHSDERGLPVPVSTATGLVPCTHVWMRRGTGCGTSEDTTLWGPTFCVICGTTAVSGRNEHTDG